LVVRFGVFEVHLASGELRKRGIKVKLHDQPLRVLTLLLERPGQVVTRDKLKEKLWAADTVVDFDHGLNSAINKVREALGDSADSPRFIETVPRNGYRFICPVATVPVGTLDAGFLSRPSAGEGTSIAVLPLRNLSGDPGQDYFADGMTEALITELGKLSGLRLLSYQSVLGYRQTAKSLPQIARELNVEVVLEGSVLRAENRIRITANLVQAVPERHLWAESYEFDQRDVLAVQGAAARDVAAQILVKVTPQEKERLVTAKPVDPEAHEAYLLGRAHLYKAGTPTSWMRAKEYFDKAIEKDPTYGPAYASLAELYIWTGGAGSLTINPTVGASDSHRQARRWAEKALALDDTLADAHNALALAKQAEWDWSAAERGYRRAIELNRSYAVARVSYAIHLYAMQRFEEAVDQAKHAQQLDPVSPFINTWAGAAYFLAGRTDEAMASLRRTLELEPGYSDASIILARSYVTLGQYHEAIAELDKAMTFGARGPFVLAAQAHAYARARRPNEALKLVDELKQCKAKLGITPTFAFIWAYAGLDDKEQAFAWLETAYEERRQRMVWLNVDAFLDPLRSDPRFHDLVRRVGLPSAGLGAMRLPSRYRLKSTS